MCDDNSSQSFFVFTVIPGDGKHLLLCLFTIYVSSWGKCYRIWYTPFLIGLFVLLLSFKSFVHYRNESFVTYVVCAHNLQFIVNPFILLTGSFTEQKFFSFMKSNLSIFLLLIMLLVSSLRTLCLVLDSKTLSYFFQKRSYVLVLHLSLWSILS